MRNALYIALNTYREALRQKVLYALALFTAVLILLSLFLGQLSLGADTKIIKDMGLAAMMVLGTMIAIFVGVGLVFKEIERKTIYAILAKPVSRGQFILGKFLGLCLTIAVEIALMTGLLFLILALYAEPIDPALLKAVVLIYAELCVLVGIALVFSSYSSSFMSVVFCLSALFVGHLTDDLSGVMLPRAREMVEKGQGSEIFLGHAIEAAVSTLGAFSLDHFVVNAKVVHGVPVPWGFVAEACGYGLALCALFLTIAVFLFRKKDLQ